MINGEHFNISTICPKKARFSQSLAIKFCMKKTEITTFPCLQAAFGNNKQIKKVSDISNTAFSRKSKNP